MVIVSTGFVPCELLLLKSCVVYVMLPVLRVMNEGDPLTPTSSRRVLRQTLDDLILSMERFNRRWAEYLAGVDLDEINQLRDGYNRFYVLEKECVVRSAHVARQRFLPLPPLTLADLAGLFPPLPVPQVRP